MVELIGVEIMLVSGGCYCVCYPGGGVGDVPSEGTCMAICERMGKVMGSCD
jgi:hypothetical protein